MPADERVLVDGVVLVPARPRRLHLELAKGLDALVQSRPDALLEELRMLRLANAEARGVPHIMILRRVRRHTAQ
eukprot:4821884-Prymnesium_polylepis.1